MEVLRHCFPNNLRRSLEELPKSLDETYKRILRDINNLNQNEAHRLLQCLAVAYRPLKLEELAEVLALDVSAGGIPKFNANWRWEDHEAAVLSACSSLVSVIIDRGSRVVQFSHFSVKEFLTSDRLASCMEEVSRFHIANEPSHVILAQACLGALLCPEEHTFEHSVGHIPLLQYATRYWVAHAKVGNVELQIKDALDYFFDLDNPHLAAFYDPSGSYDFFARSSNEGPIGVLSPAIPLYFAASSGLHSLVERLTVKQPQAIHFCGPKGTPLQLSVRAGHITVVQLLVAHGADINSRSAYKSTPLHIALQEGHLEIAKWLLDRGADVNSKGKGGVTPLHIAASEGYLEIFHMLLERNAGVHVQNLRKYTALHFAASGGHFEIARILVRRLIPKAMTELPRSSLHCPVETLTLFGYCWIAVQIYMCTTTTVTHHSTSQCPKVTTRSLKYYLSATWKSIRGTTWDQSHYT